MSKYFRILKKVEGSRESSPQEAVPSPAPSPIRPVTRGATPRPLPGRADPTAGATLVDGLLAVARATSGTIVVLAGTSRLENVPRLIAAAADEAQSRNLKLLAGRFDAEGRRLTLENHARPAIDVTWGSTSMRFHAELERVSANHDLVVLQAPPLDASSDAALLGKSFDGLVLVVRPLITSRRAIKAAVSKAKLVDCPVHGLIVDGSRAWIPGWLERLVPNHST